MLIVVAARFPIFGRPRDPQESTRVVVAGGQIARIGATGADFGQHAIALAALLESTGDQWYARRRWLNYTQAADDEGGNPGTDETRSHDTTISPED